MPWPKGKQFSDEHRAKLSSARKGIRRSASTRAKLSASLKAKGAEWHAKRTAKGNKHRVLTDGQRQKLSERAKAQWAADREGRSEQLARARQNSPVIGDVSSLHTPTSRAKASATKRAKWESLTVGERILAMQHLRTAEVQAKAALSRRGRTLSVAARARISDKNKGRRLQLSDAQRANRSSKAKAHSAAVWAKRSQQDRERITAPMQLVTKDRLAQLTLIERDSYFSALVRSARVTRPTSIERSVAAVLGAVGVEYVPQHSIGRYVVDFFVPSKALVIEADGDYWHSKPSVRARDEKKDAYLRLSGCTVLRLSESAIKRQQFATLFESVC